MNKVILFLSLLLTTCTFGFDGSDFQVEKYFSDKRIRSLEMKMARQFGAKVMVRVISRNAKREITNLEFIRYKPDGEMVVACSSDKFGLLIVSRTGCRIVDAGYENDIRIAGK